jgi:hypothetical protein
LHARHNYIYIYVAIYDDEYILLVLIW